MVESNVPERTRRRGVYGARVFGRKITVSFLYPLYSSTANKPNLIFLGGVTEFKHRKEEGSEGLEPQVFFFFFLLLKGDFVFRSGFALRSRRKDDGRRGRSEGATEAESRLFDAIVKREEAHDQLAKSLRHLHTPGKASRRR